MKILERFDSARIKASAKSYVGQGICSICKTNPAEYLSHWTVQARRGYCDECAERLKYDVKICNADRNAVACDECVLHNTFQHSYMARREGLCFYHYKMKHVL